jgi:hypothetical protein
MNDFHEHITDKHEARKLFERDFYERDLDPMGYWTPLVPGLTDMRHLVSYMKPPGPGENGKFSKIKLNGCHFNWKELVEAVNYWTASEHHHHNIGKMLSAKGSHATRQKKARIAKELKELKEKEKEKEREEKVDEMEVDKYEEKEEKEEKKAPLPPPSRGLPHAIARARMPPPKDDEEDEEEEEEEEEEEQEPEEEEEEEEEEQESEEEEEEQEEEEEEEKLNHDDLQLLPLLDIPTTIDDDH